MAQTLVLQIDESTGTSPLSDPFSPTNAPPENVFETAKKALRNRKKSSFLILSTIKQHYGISLGCACILFIGYGMNESLHMIDSDSQQLLLEAIWLLLVLMTNLGLMMRDARLAQEEMPVRLQDAIALVERDGMSDEDIHFSTISTETIAITRVLRAHGSVKLVPHCLLVTGDIVLLGLGDKSPARSCLASDETLTLESDAILKPSFFTNVGGFECLSAGEKVGELAKFRVLETPIKHIIETALEFKRPPTMGAQYLEIVEGIFTKLVWIVFVLSLAVNLIRLYLVNGGSSAGSLNIYTMVARLQVYAVIAILPVSFPTIMLISKSYANAYILTLFEALQSSKTQFEDNEDIDEFDSAPAPTKDLRLSWFTIGRKFLDQVVKFDGTRLARMTGLVDSLAHCTVICAIDREGTISAPLPALDQLLFLNSSGDPVVLDLNYDLEAPNGVRFEDNDWSNHLKSLKPFGLSTLVTTECGVGGGRKRNDLHFKKGRVGGFGMPLTARNACLCHVGREIGFNPEAISGMGVRMRIETFNSDGGTTDSTQDYHYEVPGFTSYIVSDANDTEPGFQVFSEGSLDLVLESCGDFWNGTELGHLSETVEKRIFDFAHNAIISDLQVVGFSYRPVQNPKSWPMLGEMVRKEPYHIYSPAPAPNFSPHVSFTALKQMGEPSSAPPTETPRMSASLPTPNSERFGEQKKLRRRRNRDRILSKLDIDSPIIDHQDMCTELTKGQTFLCAASYLYPPKANMVDFVEDLGLAGIRFVYFSSAPERESKAYAERLGLEIDWNSCIILSDDGTGKGYIAIHDNKAQLPRGVSTIRDHIADVDDVPLHVSLFAECKPSSIREMLKIFQEHGEVVCCIGSSLNDSNVECFVNADISIAIDPIPLHRHKVGHGPIHPLIVAASFNASPCALTLNADSSMYSITQMIREARSLAANGRQAFGFAIGIQLSITATILVSYCCLVVPRLFEGYQIMFIVWIIVPILSCSLLFTPHLPGIMTQIPAKNSELWKDVPRIVLFYIYRFCLLPVATCNALYWLIQTSISITPKPANLSLFIQNYVALVLIVHMVVISGTYVHRIESILTNNPFKNRTWIAASILCICLQIVFFSASLSVGRIDASIISSLPWWIHVISIVTILVEIPLQELVKADDRRKWLTFQKRSKLEFNTKLGMHSPL